MFLSHSQMLGHLVLCSWACPSVLLACSFSHPSPRLQEPLPLRIPHPAGCGAQSSGEQTSLSVAHPLGLMGGQSPGLPGAFAHRHTLPSPLLPGPGPGGVVSVLPGTPPGSCNSQSPSSQWTGQRVLICPPPCKCCFGQESPCKGDVTTMFKATTAAAALPPVQKKPNFFHILINPYEFLIASRLFPGNKGLWGIGWPGHLKGLAQLIKHSYQPGETQRVCE